MRRGELRLSLHWRLSGRKVVDISSDLSLIAFEMRSRRVVCHV